MSKIWYTTFTVLLVTSLVACSPKTVIIERKVVPVITEMVEVEKKGCMQMSCEGEFTAFTWVDTNADGIYDQWEAPLAGVEFLELIPASGIRPMVDREGRTIKPYQPISDQEGIARFPIVYPGALAATCEDSCKAGLEKIVVEPRVPRGYRLTTAGRQSLEEGLSFGFAPE